jgi:hypothetical protein
MRLRSAYWMRRYAGATGSVFCSISIPFRYRLGQGYQELAGGMTCYSAPTKTCYRASTMVFYPELAPNSRHLAIFLLTYHYNRIYTPLIADFCYIAICQGSWRARNVRYSTMPAAMRGRRGSRFSSTRGRKNS